MKNQKGFSLVELLVVVIIIAIIAAIAIPNLLASRRAANEASAINSLRTYHGAQATYQATTGLGVNYALDPTALTGLVDSILDDAAPVKSGYSFNLIGVASSGSTPSSYCAAADPQSASTGTRYFGVSSGNGGVVVTNAATLNCQSTGILGVAGTPIQ